MLELNPAKSPLPTFTNQQVDLLAPLPAFTTYQRNGLALTITAAHAEALPPHMLDWAVELCATNMAVRGVHANKVSLPQKLQCHPL